MGLQKRRRRGVSCSVPSLTKTRRRGEERERGNGASFFKKGKFCIHSAILSHFQATTSTIEALAQLASLLLEPTSAVFLLQQRTYRFLEGSLLPFVQRFPSPRLCHWLNQTSWWGHELPEPCPTYLQARQVALNKDWLCCRVRGPGVAMHKRTHFATQTQVSRGKGATGHHSQTARFVRQLRHPFRPNRLSVLAPIHLEAKS
jgi:hypothetical protein